LLDTVGKRLDFSTVGDPPVIVEPLAAMSAYPVGTHPLHAIPKRVRTDGDTSFGAEHLHGGMIPIDTVAAGGEYDHGTVFELHQDGRIVHIVVLFESHIGINTTDAVDGLGFRSGEPPGGVVIMGHHVGNKATAGGTELDDEILYTGLVTRFDPQQDDVAHKAFIHLLLGCAEIRIKTMVVTYLQEHAGVSLNRVSYQVDLVHGHAQGFLGKHVLAPGLCGGTDNLAMGLGVGGDHDTI